MKLLVNVLPEYFERTRGIKPGDEMEILSKGLALEGIGKRCYLVQGKEGTPIVLYENEITLIREQQEY